MVRVVLTLMKMKEFNKNMDTENLAYKVSILDEQIESLKALHLAIAKLEINFRSDWGKASIKREEEVLFEIYELQSMKARLITGEKRPEIVYIDKEVPKYIKTSEVHVKKSSLSTCFMGATLAVYSMIALAYYLRVFSIHVN